MAVNMRDVKRQIGSVQNMKQITKAMEMVAASKLRKAQANAEAARPYAEKIREVISSIAASDIEVSHPMLESRPVKKTGYIVITSDKGLAGGYNANVLRKAMDTLRTNHASPDEYAVLVLGRKGRDYFRKREIPLLEEITDLPDAPRFSDIRTLTEMAVKHFADQHYDELNLIYNEFVNPIQQTPVMQKLLPLDTISDETDTAATAKATEYLYEPSAKQVLDVLLPKYAETLIYSALLEGKASEFGAKMTAMGNATNNASDLISSLTLIYNRARQAAITQEITEIVAGANAQ